MSLMASSSGLLTYNSICPASFPGVVVGIKTANVLETAKCCSTARAGAEASIQALSPTPAGLSGFPRQDKTGRAGGSFPQAPFQKRSFAAWS